jgi:hypothetical protein
MEIWPRVLVKFGQVLERTVGAKYWMEDHLFYPGCTCRLVVRRANLDHSMVVPYILLLPLLLAASAICYLGYSLPQLLATSATRYLGYSLPMLLATYATRYLCCYSLPLERGYSLPLERLLATSATRYIEHRGYSLPLL